MQEAMTAAWTGISTLAEVAASTFTEEGSSTKHVIRANQDAEPFAPPSCGAGARRWQRIGAAFLNFFMEHSMEWLQLFRNILFRR